MSGRPGGFRNVVVSGRKKAADAARRRIPEPTADQYGEELRGRTPEPAPVTLPRLEWLDRVKTR